MHIHEHDLAGVHRLWGSGWAESRRQRHVPIKIRRPVPIKNDKSALAGAIDRDLIQRAVRRPNRREGERRSLVVLSFERRHATGAQKTNRKNSKKLPSRLHQCASPSSTFEFCNECVAGRAVVAPAFKLKCPSSLRSREEPPTHSVRTPATVSHSPCAVDQYCSCRWGT